MLLQGKRQLRTQKTHRRAQLGGRCDPDAHRYGTDILIRTDTSGCARAFLAHIRGLRTLGMRTFCSAGYPSPHPFARPLLTPPGG